MKQWIYKVYTVIRQREKMKLNYKIDKEAMVAYIDVNKPDKHIIGDDRNALTSLIDHFTALGYCVLVRDR